MAVVSVHLVRVRCGPITAGTAASRARKRPLPGPLCKPTCHSIACATLVRRVSSSEAIRGVLGRWPKHSQTFWSPLTNDRQLPEQRPQVAPVHEAQGVPGRCVLSASVLPGGPRHHACRGVPSRCNAHTMVVSMATWVPPRTGKPLTTTSNLRLSKAFALGRPCHGSSNLRALVYLRRPSIPPPHMLLDGGHKDQVNGHIGSCVQREGGPGEGDEAHHSEQADGLSQNDYDLTHIPTQNWLADCLTQTSTKADNLIMAVKTG